MRGRCNECRKQGSAEYRESRGEELRLARQGEYRRNNETYKNWRSRNAAHIASYNAAYYDNAEEYNAFRGKRYRQENVPKIIAKNQKRRAQHLAAPGAYTAEEWDALCAQYDYRCLCCGMRKQLTVDHVLPLSRGGSNTINNLQPLCSSCNSSKGTKHIDYRPEGGRRAA